MMPDTRAPRRPALVRARVVTGGMLVIALVVLAAGRCEATTHVTTQKNTQNARRLYELGRFLDAATAYEAAYKETGEPILMFNLGQCHRRLGNDTKALEFYTQYLRREPEAPNRPEVQRWIAQAQENIRAKEPMTVKEAAIPIAANVGPTLFLRAGLGLGVDQWNLTAPNIHASGASAGGTLALGLNFTARWAAFCEVGGSRTFEPEITSKDYTVPYLLSYGTRFAGIGAAWSLPAAQDVRLFGSARATAVESHIEGDEGPPGGGLTNNGPHISSYGLGLAFGAERLWRTSKGYFYGLALEFSWGGGDSVLSDEIRRASVRRGGLNFVFGYN